MYLSIHKKLIISLFAIGDAVAVNANTGILSFQFLASFRLSTKNQRFK